MEREGGPYGGVLPRGNAPGGSPRRLWLTAAGENSQLSHCFSEKGTASNKQPIQKHLLSLLGTGESSTQNLEGVHIVISPKPNVYSIWGRRSKLRPAAAGEAKLTRPHGPPPPRSHVPLRSTISAFLRALGLRATTPSIDHGGLEILDLLNAYILYVRKSLRFSTQNS